MLWPKAFHSQERAGQWGGVRTLACQSMQGQVCEQVDIRPFFLEQQQANDLKLALWPNTKHIQDLWWRWSFVVHFSSCMSRYKIRSEILRVLSNKSCNYFCMGQRSPVEKELTFSINQGQNDHLVKIKKYRCGKFDRMRGELPRFQLSSLSKLRFLSVCCIFQDHPWAWL